jgi:ClpP class serine protease
MTNAAASYLATHRAPAAPRQRRPARRALSFAARVPWCITPDYMETIVSILERTNSDPDALAAERGQPLKNSYAIEVRDGVAIIPIRGVIARYANLFSEISGATSLELLVRDFDMAVQNDAITAIMLDIDSPGGEANGISEMAGRIANARSVKPVVAYVGGAACSAAYWLASACSEIVCSDTALLGSIGVVVTLRKPSADDDEMEIVSSNAENKRPDVATDDGQEVIRKTLNELEQVFLSSVADYRSMTIAQVIDAGDRGGIRVGQSAVDNRLADRIGTYEAVMTELHTRASMPMRPRAIAHPSVPAAITAVSDLAGAVYAAAAAPLDTNRTAAVRGDISARSQHTKDILPMSDTPVQAVPVPEPSLSSLPTISVSDPDAQAQINAMVAQMTAGFEAQRKAILEQAQVQFQRQIAEMEARQRIDTYAQHATTPTLTRPHALPFTADALSSFLLSLNAEQRTQACSMFDTMLSAGLVNFEEIGSQGNGDERPAADEYEEAVTLKMKTGLSRSDAISAVRREKTELVKRYNEGN